MTLRVSQLSRFNFFGNALLRGLPLLLISVCVTFTVKAQMSSASFQLSSGSYVGGGGSSSRNGTGIVGSVCGSGAKMTAADNWACYAGPIGIALGAGGELLAFYSTKLVDTVQFEPQTLKVIFGGGAGTLSGKLFFRPGGAVAYNELNLIKADGDTMLVQLPSDSLGLRGMEYYFELLRGTDTVYLAAKDSPYLWLTHFTNQQGRTPDLTRERSYRIIGLPIAVEGSRTVDAVFEDDLGAYNRTNWRLGGFDPRQDTVFEFTETYPVEPGRGYWLITRERERYGAAGYSVRPNLIHNGRPYYAVPVQRGWNQIADPFGFAVDFEDVLFEKAGTVWPHDSTVSIYWYAGAGYSTPKIMTPWTGYFFFTWEPALRLLIPYEEYGLSTGAKLSPLAHPTGLEYDWGIALSMTANGKESELCYAGVAAEALSDYDRLDQPLPPTPPGDPVIGFLMPDHNRYLWRIDSRPPNDSLQSWTVKLGNGLDRQLRLAPLESVPYEQAAILLLDIGTQIPITGTTTVSIPNDVSTAQLIVGSTAKVEQLANENLPDSYELMQNYPNPFNPNTAIRFSLPTAGEVRLEIFNLLGQRVRLLTDRFFEAGVHTIEWNGKLEQGSAAASGVYLYRLTSGSFVASKKMVLIK